MIVEPGIDVVIDLGQGI